MDNSNKPQETPQQPTPEKPAEQQPMQTPPQPVAGHPAPPAPINVPKMVRYGWVFFGASVVVTIVGLYLGYALAISAIIAALAGRMGLQAKNKPLAITALTFCGITLLLFIIASVTS